MSTRSMIGRRNSDGTIRAIYCHWDGYPEHNGAILQRFYCTESKISDLLALGDLSSLGIDIGQVHDFNDSELAQVNGWCTAYSRDRGETGVDSCVYTDVDELIKEANWCDYFYVFEGGNHNWVCYDSNGDIVDIPEESRFISA